MAQRVLDARLREQAEGEAALGAVQARVEELGAWFLLRCFSLLYLHINVVLLCVFSMECCRIVKGRRRRGRGSCCCSKGVVYM